MNHDMVSFVIRFVRESGENEEVRWRGIIKHVQGDTETHFTRFNEAIEFMQNCVNDMIRQSFDETKPETKQNILLETAFMWGDMMPKVTQVWLDTMKDVLKSSPEPTQLWTKQYEQMLSFWQGAAKSETPRQADLEAQIRRLQARVAELEREIQQLRQNPPS